MAGAKQACLRKVGVGWGWGKIRAMRGRNGGRGEGLGNDAGLSLRNVRSHCHVLDQSKVV